MCCTGALQQYGNMKLGPSIIIVVIIFSQPTLGTGVFLVACIIYFKDQLFKVQLKVFQLNLLTCQQQESL